MVYNFLLTIDFFNTNNTSTKYSEALNSRLWLRKIQNDSRSVPEAIGKAQEAQFGTQHMKLLFMYTGDCFKCTSGLNLCLHR